MLLAPGLPDLAAWGINEAPADEAAAGCARLLPVLWSYSAANFTCRWAANQKLGCNCCRSTSPGGLPRLFLSICRQCQVVRSWDNQ